MARKATDLLDVFRSERVTPGSGAASGAAAKHGREPAAGAKRGFSGMVLLPRQILLGASVVVLLLVFTFVLGLSVGRRGGEGAPTDPASLSRATARQGFEAQKTFVEGRVPFMDRVRHVANDPAKLAETLTRMKGVPGDNIWIRDDVANQGLVIAIGPFDSRDQAAEYLRRAGLFTFKVGGVLPWKTPDYTSKSLASMPAHRLPRR